MRVEGKGQEFGVTDQMTKYEALKAFGANIGGRENALRGAGKSDEEIEVEIARQLKQADVAAEIRERRGLVRGIARQGIELGGFANYEKVGADTSADADRNIVANFRRSDAGKAAQRRADLSDAEVERGNKRQKAVAELEETRIDLTRAGELEKSRLTALVGEKGASLSGVSPEDQLINERTVGRLRNRAANLGITEDDVAKFNTDEHGFTGSSDVWARPQAMVDDEIKSLLRLIAEKIEAGNKQAAKADAPPAAPVAPPPRPANRPLVMPAPAPGGGRRQ
jgi:hypothetical protein